MRNKVLAMSICVLLCISIAVSFTFIVTATDHECEAAECYTCEIITICTGFLLSFIGGMLIFAFSQRRRSIKTIKNFITVLQPVSTPVSLKVKLIH